MTKILVTALQDIHPVIQKEHLHPTKSNDKFLFITEEKFDYLKKNFKENGIYSKAETGCDFTIAICDGNYYAIYYGVNHTEYGVDGLALGTGGYATVKVIQLLNNGQFSAEKVQKKSHISENEVSILKHINANTQTNKKLVEMINQSKSDAKKPIAEKKGERHRFFMDIAQGINAYDLLTRIVSGNSKTDGLSPFRLLELALELAKSLKLLHSINVIHNDIKMENIFLLSTLEGVKASFIDHGFAKIGDFKCEKIFGSEMYLAPEIFDKCEYNTKTDIYSLGIVYAVIFGLCGIAKENLNEETIDRIFVSASPNSTKIPDDKTIKAIWDMIKAMTNSDREKRLSLDLVIQRLTEIVNHYEKKIRIGIVDLDQYKKLTNSEKAKLYANLKKFDDVLLVQDKKTDSLFDLSMLRAEMRSQNIFVNLNMFHLDDEKDIVKLMPDYLADNYSKYKLDCYFVEPGRITNILASKKMKAEAIMNFGMMGENKISTSVGNQNESRNQISPNF